MFTCLQIFFQVHILSWDPVSLERFLCHAPVPSSSASPLPSVWGAERCKGRALPCFSCCTLAPRIHSSSPTPPGKANNLIFIKSRLRNSRSESAFLALCISSYLRDAHLIDVGRKIIWVEIITKIHSDVGVDGVWKCFFEFFIPQTRNTF